MGLFHSLKSVKQRVKYSTIKDSIDYRQMSDKHMV